ncbi:PilZ domain-containing protein [Isoptericola sp. b441]|uniref:PilZ domain-containing protein n=1 Tax=Actinotalea lenta TaxID=3064654 RepID=A0ABT9DEB4_9CELL|nr:MULTISPECIES: PilZ domain-containing protein [unclassified Isoptericola]MDO8107728.1 PilZ domain-containing protein [Isoptericola sp. b441]MDO8120601.1 PilZ domain-containing protein [Isoptericola sp. b490]
MAFEADPCELRTPEGELIARGFVREHEDDTLVIDAQSLGNTWFDEGDVAVVEVFDADRGALTYHGAVEFAAAKRVRLRDLRLQVARQQRSAVRVPTDLPVPIVAQLGVEPGEEPGTVVATADVSAVVELSTPWMVTVIDLSAHGLRFLAEQRVDPGTRWRVVLPAPRRSLDLVVEVVRADEVRGGVAHGARFVDAHERDHDVLFGWVLDLQRQQLALRAERR